jgi:hypothetical protein
VTEELDDGSGEGKKSSYQDSRVGGTAQVLKCQPGKHEALSSNPSMARGGELHQVNMQVAKRESRTRLWESHGCQSTASFSGQPQRFFKSRSMVVFLPVKAHPLQKAFPTG